MKGVFFFFSSPFPHRRRLERQGRTRTPTSTLVARGRRTKCQPTQQVMRFDIWHQGVIRPAPAADGGCGSFAGGLSSERGGGRGRSATHAPFCSSEHSTTDLKDGGIAHGSQAEWKRGDGWSGEEVDVGSFPLNKSDISK